MSEHLKGKEIAHAKMVNGTRLIEFTDGSKLFVYADGSTKQI